MTTTVSPPSCEPQQFVAGDTVQWLKTVSLYPASDGWTLKYAFKGPGTLATQTATTDASGCYSVSILASASATTTAGVYRLFGWVENADASQRHTVYDGSVTVLPNVATTAFALLQTQNELMLAALDAALLGRATADMQQYAIDGTAITKIPFEKLAFYRGIYAGKVWRERNRGKTSPEIALVYTQPSRRTNAGPTDGQWPGNH